MVKNEIQRIKNPHGLFGMSTHRDEMGDGLARADRASGAERIRRLTGNKRAA